jgi:MFS family permease
MMMNFGAMYVCRFLFGAGEAGCFPNLTKAFTSWLPTGERVRVQGIMWMSARWGGAITPLLVALTFTFVSWRIAFVIYGALGVVWAVFFYKWFRDLPREHKSVNAAEVALIEDGIPPPSMLVTVPSPAAKRFSCVCRSSVSRPWSWHTSMRTRRLPCRSF